MKNLITAMACIMVLLVIILQFTQSQTIYNRLMAADQAVNCFREMIREEGCVSEKEKVWLQNELGKILHCKADQVQVNGTGHPLHRGELISYHVKAPVSRVILMPWFWNIDQENNSFDYELNQYAVSTYPGRSE